MPAKLTIPRDINIVYPTTYLPFTSLNQGYINTNMRLRGTSLVIEQTKLYYVGLSVTMEQIGKNVFNTAEIKVLRNNNTILEFLKTYDENDAMTLSNAAYIPLNAGDVITASITFDNLSPSKIFVRANATSTFLNVV